MSNVEDEIVSMKFDNASFESKLGDTIKSLDKLRQSLDFANSKRGMDDLSAASKNLNFSHIAEGVDSIAGKFKALSVIGIGALMSIGAKAFDVGSRFVKSFTVAPIMDGFREFETKVGSIQTILANTARFGTGLDEVTKNLDQLNTYADKTIYSFGDMTKNIGLFTNAGIRIGDATSMIKGFSNSAAASGTNAEGAARAAYQLSQALSAGQIRLMDWRSLTNVGMGNKNMQLALVDIANKMGTLKKSGIAAKDVQKDFNKSLEKGWLSADVMSTYLKIMAGDMDKAKIQAMGFTGAEADAFLKQAKTAEEAATKVRTFTQLIGTVKEAVGSGWAGTFDIVIGNFNEATDLFTRVNNHISKAVENSTKARNKIFEGWKKFGGRKTLIDSLFRAMKDISSVIGTIKNAFGDVFPPMTATTLIKMTAAFSEFTKKMQPSTSTLNKLHRVFQGLFSIFDIGITIIKELVKFVFHLLGNFSGVGHGAADATVKVGDFLIKLDDMLVKGGGIHKFFQNLGAQVSKVADFFKHFGNNVSDLKDKIVGFFKHTKGFEVVGERIGQRFHMLSGLASAVGNALQWLADRFKGVRKVMGKVWDFIKDFFSNLGESIKKTMKPGDFDPAVDALNVGLLGGILLIMRKISKGFKVFFKGSFGLDKTGLGKKLNELFEGLTGQLKAMQAEVKSRALLRIAEAVGILTASLLVLSLIDSKALTKALLAITVAFGELIGSMTLMDKALGGKSSAKMVALAAGMMVIAGAMVILAVAVRILAKLSWAQLAKGLAGVAGMLVAMVTAVKLITTDVGGLIRAGIAMGAIAIALFILSKAVKSFAKMSWGEMVKGMTGMASGLLVIVGAMKLMPVGSTLAAGAAMIPLATGLLILSKAVKSFAKMGWTEMGKGLLGIAGALVAIGIAMNLMPVTLPITAAGLILVGGALLIISKAIQSMGSIPFGTMAKGIGAMAVTLGVLAVALNLMNGTLMGSAALIVAAGALAVLSKVIRTLASVKTGDLIKGIAAMAAIIGVIAGMSIGLEAAIPAMLGLGLALAFVGAGFALFGLGAILFVKAIQIIAKIGVAGMKTVAAALPEILYAFVKSLTKVAEDILNSAPLFVDLITKLLLKVLDTVIALVPKIAEAISAFIDAGVILLQSKFPTLLETGFQLLTQLLLGIYQHMPEITILVANIIATFLGGIADNIQKIVDAGIKLISKLLGGIASKASDIALAGLNVLVQLLAGIANNLIKVVVTVGLIIAKFLAEIGNAGVRIVAAGVSILTKLLEGIGNAIPNIAKAILDVAKEIARQIGVTTPKVVEAGFQMMIDLFNGISDVINRRSAEVGEALAGLAEAFAGGVGKALKAAIKKIVEDILPPGMGKVVNKVLSIFGVESPSKVFYWIGDMLMQGLSNGIFENMRKPAEALADGSGLMLDSMSNTMSKLADAVSQEMDVNPTITPVLDLTHVKAGAKSIDDLMKASALMPVVSFDTAKLISASTSTAAESKTLEPASGPTEIKFEQNNYSPKALTARDIYRGTKSQIALAKEELKIK